MKNQDKLCDALGMVDEAIIQDSLLHTIAPVRSGGDPRAVLRRRLAVLASACAALALMAGILLAVPLLTADDPVDTEPPSLTESAGSPYEDAMLVSLSQLADGQATVVSDPAMQSEAIPAQTARPDAVDDSFKSYFVLNFDCKPGETVEVRTDTECLRPVDLPSDDPKNGYRDFYYALFKGEAEGVYTALLHIDPSESCIQVNVPFQTGYMDDAILEFNIYDEEKRVTGIGSMLVARYYPQTEEERELTPVTFSVTRSTVLGSVRFADPDAVTEEQVQALFEEFYDKADEAREALDFTPKTPYEVKLNAEIEIRRQFVGRQVGLGSGKSSWEDFSIFDVTVYAENGIDVEKEHRYIVMDDGSWFEMQFHQGCHSTCHMDELCPNPTGGNPDYHALNTGCHVLALDGRVYEVQAYIAEDGSERETLVLIQEPKA